jgi:hypothetical protein
MPYDATGATTLTLTREDGKTTTVNVNVGDAQPGLFTSDASGKGPAAATLADSSLLTATNPATRGNVVVLYATGLGRVAPAATTGVGVTAAANCVNPVTVTIAGRTVTPDYAGLTPGYPGLYQINVRIPADLAATGNVPLKVTAAGIDSNSVTIAVRWRSRGARTHACRVETLVSPLGRQRRYKCAHRPMPASAMPTRPCVPNSRNRRASFCSISAGASGSPFNSG